MSNPKIIFVPKGKQHLLLNQDEIVSPGVGTIDRLTMCGRRLAGMTGEHIAGDLHNSGICQRCLSSAVGHWLAMKWVDQHRTIDQLRRGHQVDGELVLSVHPSEADGEPTFNVHLTGNRWVSGYAGTPVDPPGELSDRARAEWLLVCAREAERQAWRVFNDTLPPLPQNIRDEDDRIQALCPASVTAREAELFSNRWRTWREGDRCEGELSMTLKAYESAKVWGWGQSEWNRGQVLLHTWGEDAETDDAISLTCINNHRWQVPADHETTDDS